MLSVIDDENNEVFEPNGLRLGDSPAESGGLLAYKHSLHTLIKCHVDWN